MAHSGFSDDCLLCILLLQAVRFWGIYKGPIHSSSWNTREAAGDRDHSIMEVWYFNLIQLDARGINWKLKYTYVFGFPSWFFYIKFPKVMFSHFDSLGVLHKAESCFLNKCGCRYSYESLSSIPQKPYYFTERYLDVKKVLVDTFYGPPKEGVYSPSVQNTLYLMAKSVLNRSLSLSLSLSLCGTRTLAHTQIHLHPHAHILTCPHTCMQSEAHTHTHAWCVCWH